MEDSNYSFIQTDQLSLEQLNANLSQARPPKFSPAFNSALEKSLLKFEPLALHDTLLRIRRETHDLKSFCSHLSQLSFFKDFSHLHVIVHEKGQRYTRKLEFSPYTEARSTQHELDEFVDFFNSIKKSKANSYGSSKIQDGKHQVLGTFLPMPFTFLHHSVIFLVSNGDFLPFDEQTKELFTKRCRVIAPFIESILEDSAKDANLGYAQKVLDHLPMHFSFYHKEQLVFSNLDSPQSASSRVEVDQLNTFRIETIFDELLVSSEVFHNDRIKVLGELFNILKHELSNPLFGVELSNELLLEQVTDADRLSFLEQIKLSVANCRHLIENSKSLYSENTEKESFNLVHLIEEVLLLTKSKTRSLMKELVPPSQDLVIRSNRSWLAQVVFNLVVNAAEATGPQGQLSISFSKKTHTVEILFIDDGPGIPQKKQELVFKPFFTTKEKGTGLGLWICRTLMRKLGGDLELLNADKGTCFRLVLQHENPDH